MSSISIIDIIDRVNRAANFARGLDDAACGIHANTHADVTGLRTMLDHHEEELRSIGEAIDAYRQAKPDLRTVR